MSLSEIFAHVGAKPGSTGKLSLYVPDFYRHMNDRKCVSKEERKNP